MSGSVASGTHCIFVNLHDRVVCLNQLLFFKETVSGNGKLISLLRIGPSGI